MSCLFPVAEKFTSINGEGVCAGELAVFIRFRKCNLRCSYCDTLWANSHTAPAELLTAEEITDYILSTGVKNVTLTGGEPLLQENLHLLTDILITEGLRVEIETNGSLPVERLASRSCRPVFTMDYKLPSSGMENKMCTENFLLLNKNDTVKFVSGSTGDLDRALEIIRDYSLLSRCHVYFSPVFGKLPPDRIVDFMKEHNLNGARIQLQLHKFIWNPDKRGV
ncbi:MAG: putative 7-carboxy-7-deazaguanine synthase QueE [Ruminococcus sp.]|nr:putative 7-carboxy-7-deazaguanine synthase QueE [Ruminococcus sp.]